MVALIRAQVAGSVVTNAEPAIQADLIRLLSRPGFALHPDGSCRSGLLALATYRAIRRSHDDTALLAAAGVELAMQSAFVFDDIADGSAGDSGSEDLALAIALLAAGTATAAEAVAGATEPAAAMRHSSRANGSACAGQFLDARLEKRGGATLDEALEMTCLKSGSLGRFAAGFAARVAGADTESTALFERFAFNLLSFAQLADDQRDAWEEGTDSDTARGKSTVPLVFRRRRGSVDPTPPLDVTMRRRFFDAYTSSNASAYTAIVALAYLARARADLRLLADRGHVTGALDQVLQNVESGAAGTLGSVGPGVVA